MSQKKILIAEDDLNIQDILRLYMEKEDYRVFTASNGSEALHKYREVKPDIILLDIMMPILDGLEVCKEIRKESNVPIIMLTARGETVDRVTGLELGADDYIPKPFEMREVLARVRAVMRRYEQKPAAEDSKRISYDGLEVDIDAYRVTIRGVPVDMPPKEIEMLYFFGKNPNRVFTRNQLLDQVWGVEYFGDTRTIDVHIKRMRDRLEGVSDRWSLKTVWGVGYKFEAL